jgi:hypothetical protein
MHGMTVYAICRNCAEVHPASLPCPGCASFGSDRMRTADAPVAAQTPAVAPGLEPLPRALQPHPHHPVARPLLRMSSVVVSAYFFAVLVLVIAVLAQV